MQKFGHRMLYKTFDNVADKTKDEVDHMIRFIHTRSVRTGLRSLLAFENKNTKYNLFYEILH